MDVSERKQLIDEMKEQWKNLWCNRLDDKVRAEGIADKDYSLLLVERGTVIIATRRFRVLDFQDILKQHFEVSNGLIPPDPSTGGWGKFIRTVLDPEVRKHRKQQPSRRDQKGAFHKQLKKGGRGWLHIRA